MTERLTRLFPGIDTCPLFYISTHGMYDMEKYQGGVPVETTVPANTLVIETGTIEEYCFFTNVLAILTPLLKDRTKLLSYLSGEFPAEDDDGFKQIIATCLSRCQIYFPGQKIGNRILVMTGGLYRSNENKDFKKRNRMESERTGDYGKMGFYKYDIGKEPFKIIEARFNELVMRAYGNVGSRGYHVNESKIPFDTYETMFGRIGEEYPLPFKIIIFSSCGELRDTPKIDRERRSLISRLQEEARRLWKERIGVDFQERRTTLLSVKFNPTIASKFGMAPYEYVPRRPGHFVERQGIERNYNLRTSRKKGGRRKKRKTRKIL
jgi:hypothetical protein